MKATKRALLATAALVVAAFAAQAQAQVTTPQATKPDDSSPTDVVVTAQKRTERLQDVPISIEVLSGKKLDAFHASDFRSIASYVPNVNVETTAGDNTIYIRGFGSPPANFSFDQSVSLYIDGIYAGRGRQSQAPFFDLQRVEVLRGPQGALFGKNTAAGAINIISAGPTDKFQGEVTGLYNFDLKGYDLTGFVSGPITKDISARIAVKVLDQDGYIKNLFNGHMDPENQEQLARLTVRYAPPGNFDFTAKVDYGNRDMIGGVTVSSPLTTPQDPHTFRYSTQNVLGDEGTKTTSLLVSGTGNLKLGDFTLTSVSGYSFYRGKIINNFDQALPTGGFTGNSVFNSYPQHFRQFSQELRLLSPTGRKLEYIVGGYYDDALFQLTQFGGFNIPALNYNAVEETDFRQRARSYSVFGQATYHVLDSLRLVGSLRYTQSDKRGFFTGHMVYGPFPIRPLTTAHGSISEDNVDPSITIQYDVLPRVMVYATYGRGSKSGGFVSNTYGTTDKTFVYQPEQSENYEAGAKSTLFGGRLVLNGAVYNTSFKNLQVSVYNSTLQVYQTGNAASASSKGVELSSSWYPVHNFDLSASAAYQDVKYDDYPGAACLATQPLSQCNPASPASIAANNIAGSPLSYISKFSGTATAHYVAELPGELRLDSTVTVSGRSKFFNADNQNPVYGVQKGYAKVDLRIQLAPVGERWHVALVGKNLTDELTTGSSFLLPSPITAAPRAILYLEETRSIGLEAGIRF